MKRNLTGIFVLLVLAQVSLAKSYLIHNDQEFKTANNNAHPGDVIRIANGTYAPWAITLSASGTQTQPITLTAETKGKVIFTGNVKQTLIKITGNYAVVNGISFKDCKLLKENGQTGLHQAKYLLGLCYPY